MPVTLSAPVAQPNIPTINDVAIEGSAERPAIILAVQQVDANGNVLPVVRLTMTPGAFLTAIQAASGTWKNRLYIVALNQLGQTGTVT